MTELDWQVKVRTILDEGGGEAMGDRRFLPLATLESGARCGLDRDHAWLLVPGDERPAVTYSEPEAYLWHEVLEWKRAQFEGVVEEAARAAGLPPELVYSFPAVGVIRAVLARKSSYLTRLALSWLLPSELRELRAEIREVTVTPNMPVPVKQLAERLIVPE